MNRLTIREAYYQGKNTLSRAGLKSPAFDALCLLEKAFGIKGRAGLAVHGGETADPEKLRAFGELISRRTREPLQYILGSWEFCGMELNVGEGVLIPREDTCVLVETACAGLEGIISPKILDLCAGSGAVGLAVARRIPDAEVICVEKSREALPYLSRNISAFGQGRVRCVEGDVLLPPPQGEFGGKFDCIVSNPPYIPAGDIDGLEWEVRREPRIALDGGSDGLTFYRALCALWKPLLRDGGLIAFEIGYDIRDGVIDIMRQSGIAHITAAKDLNEIDRCVFGTTVS